MCVIVTIVSKSQIDSHHHQARYELHPPPHHALLGFAMGIMIQQFVTSQARSLVRQRHALRVSITSPLSPTVLTNRDIVPHNRDTTRTPPYLFRSYVISTPAENINSIYIRTFKTVGDYHNVADDTLNSIQDAVEDYIEDVIAPESDDDEMIPEVNYADGVLSLSLPPHGTWILNKQTPNQQIWWSSPLSGPRRYEYDEGREIWVYSRVADEGGTPLSPSSSEGSEGGSIGEEDTLGGILNKEFKELYGEALGGNDEFRC